MIEDIATKSEYVFMCVFFILFREGENNKFTCFCAFSQYSNIMCDFYWNLLKRPTVET